MQYTNVKLLLSRKRRHNLQKLSSRVCDHLLEKEVTWPNCDRKSSDESAQGGSQLCMCVNQVMNGMR